MVPGGLLLHLKSNLPNTESTVTWNENRVTIDVSKSKFQHLTGLGAELSRCFSSYVFHEQPERGWLNRLSPPTLSQQQLFTTMLVSDEKRVQSYKTSGSIIMFWETRTPYRLIIRCGVYAEVSVPKTNPIRSAVLSFGTDHECDGQTDGQTCRIAYIQSCAGQWRNRRNWGYKTVNRLMIIFNCLTPRVSFCIRVYFRISKYTNGLAG